MPNPCPPCRGIPYAGTVGWGGGYPFSCPRPPPTHQGPELWEQGGVEETRGPRCMGGSLGAPPGAGVFRTSLLVHPPEAAPQHTPQAEVAGNLEVVALLQNLRGGAGDQAPGPVSPLLAVVRRWWGRCPGGRAHPMRGAAVSGRRASQRDGQAQTHTPSGQATPQGSWPQPWRPGHGQESPKPGGTLLGPSCPTCTRPDPSTHWAGWTALPAGSLPPPHQLAYWKILPLVGFAQVLGSLPRERLGPTDRCPGLSVCPAPMQYLGLHSFSRDLPFPGSAAWCLT